MAAIDDLSIATQIDDVVRQLAEVTASATEAETEADKVRQPLSSMAADYDRGRALGDVYIALADLYTDVGVDLVPPDVDVTNLDDLTKKVQVAIRPWEDGELPTVEIPPAVTAGADPKLASASGSHAS